MDPFSARREGIDDDDDRTYPSFWGLSDWEYNVFPLSPGDINIASIQIASI